MTRDKAQVVRPAHLTGVLHLSFGCCLEKGAFLSSRTPEFGRLGVLADWINFEPG